MYQQQRKPGSGRLWPNDKGAGNPRAPKFTGELVLLDGRTVRVSMWESFANRGQGPFNGFSLKLSEDTRQNGGYQAQGGYGQPQGYGQGQQGGYTPQNAPHTTQSAPPPAYGGNQQGGYGSQNNGPPPPSFGPEDDGYIPGFDD